MGRFRMSGPCDRLPFCLAAERIKAGAAAALCGDEPCLRAAALGKVLRDQAAGTQKTVTGSVVTITDGIAGKQLLGLAAEIRPVQAGSGTPSPTNVRPITGSTGVTVTQNGETAVSVTFPDEPGTVYGGAIDLKAGTLTVTGVILSGAGLPQTWTRRELGSNRYRYFASIPQEPAAYEDIAGCKMISSHFRLPTSTAYASAEDNSAWYSLTTSSPTFQVIWLGNDFETGAAFRAWLVENGVQFYLPLANPVTYQITPAQMPVMAEGTNVFSANTGDVTVTYYARPEEVTG